MAEAFIDPDPDETQDWLESLEGVVEVEGERKARHLVRELNDHLRNHGVTPPNTTISPYKNTIPPEKSEKIPGDSYTAMKVASFVRWNAMAMVARANLSPDGLGGHIASFSSSSAIYEVGHNWFFRGLDAPNGPDLVYFQGHSAPGMYARAFVEGRLDEEHLVNFRREVDGKGLSFLSASPSYAGILAVSHGVHGAGPLNGDLPGPFYEVHGCPGTGKAGRPQGLGIYGGRGIR